MPKLSNRTDTFTESMIRKMTRISIDNNAINLSQGFPDFNPPKALLDRLAEVSYENHHQYEVTWGSQAIREGLAKKPVSYTHLVYNKSPKTKVLPLQQNSTTI